VKRPGGAGKTYIADALVRRPAPKLPAKPGEAAVKLEPVIGDEIFDHILYVVRMQALQMEQSPKTYATMDEEARRDLFLATLNTHYEGRGSAEAFNVAGKTDILIPYGGEASSSANASSGAGPRALRLRSTSSSGTPRGGTRSWP
jgi:hypothetical protein